MRIILIFNSRGLADDRLPRTRSRYLGLRGFVPFLEAASVGSASASTLTSIDEYIIDEQSWRWQF